MVGTDTLEDMVIGELGLDGRGSSKRCAFPGSHGQGEGYQRCFLPIENVAEGLVMEG